MLRVQAWNIILMDMQCSFKWIHENLISLLLKEATSAVSKQLSHKQLFSVFFFLRMIIFRTNSYKWNYLGWATNIAGGEGLVFL